MTEKRITLKDMLRAWGQEADRAMLLEVGAAMVPLMQMLGTAQGTPQNTYNVDVYAGEDHACMLTMYWGEFVVLRLPDRDDMKDVWAMLVPIDCEEHGREWQPFPMVSTLPHMLRTGLTMCINSYMAKELGEVVVPHGCTTH